MVIIIVACLGDLQLFITFTNIYRVKLEIACVRMSFENIYIYICMLCIYMHTICLCLWDWFLTYVSFTPLSLLVSTYCKEGTFLMHFCFSLSLAVPFGLPSLLGSLIYFWVWVWDLYLCNGRGDIHHLLCSLSYFALTSIIKLCSVFAGVKKEHKKIDFSLLILQLNCVCVCVSKLVTDCFGNA